MKKYLTAMLIGSATTFVGIKSYEKYRPVRNLDSQSALSVNTFINNHNIGQMIKAIIMMGYMQMSKSFLDYGMREQLKGFSFYQVYFNNDQLKSDDITKSYCIFSPNDTLCGHPNILHGGASATIIDQNSGLLAMIHSREVVATAELSIKYLIPVKKGQLYVWKGVVERREDRKIYIKSTIQDLETKNVAAEATVLMMTVEWEHKLAQVFKLLFKKKNEPI